MVVNFLYQLAWATGCPDTWLNVIPGTCMRMFLDEISMYIGDGVKQTALPNVSGLIQSVAGLNATKRLSEGLTVLELGHWSSPAFGLGL